MLKQNWRFISRLERVGDFVIAVFCFFLAYYGRNSLYGWDEKLGLGLPFEGPALAPIKDYFIVLVVALISYALVLNVLGAYGRMRLSSSLRLLMIFSMASLIVFFILAAVLFMLKIDLSRSFIAIYCVLMALMLTAERYVVLELLRFFRRRGFNFRSIIICGIGPQALRMAQEIAAKPELGIRIRLFADLHETLSSAEIEDFRQQLRRRGLQQAGRVVMGTSALEKCLREYAIDEVIFTEIKSVMPQVEEAVLICSEQGVRTTIAADLFSISLVKSGISYFGGIPLIHFQTPPGDRWELVLKRFLDITLSALLLVLLAPLFLIIGVLIKITSRGPVFFVQKRVGLNGRLFNMYKFRSMRYGAEAELEKFRSQNEMKGPAFKLKYDPRVTPLGRFLRRFSLDELPQLWNVFIGDMSLVGPRPPVPGEVNAYARHYRRRLSMRPGMTCTWQVSGRNEIKDFDTWVKLDLEYIDNWSLWRDLSLLLRTIPAVLMGQGAR